MQLLGAKTFLHINSYYRKVNVEGQLAFSQYMQWYSTGNVVLLTKAKGIYDGEEAIKWIKIWNQMNHNVKPGKSMKNCILL